MGIFAKLFNAQKDNGPQEALDKCLPKVDHYLPEIEQQCLDFIKTRVPGFSRLGCVCGEVDVRFTPMPGYDEERGWVYVENSYGRTAVKMTVTEGGECERFVMSCLALAKVGTIWIGFSNTASVLMNADRLKFMDQGETFESLRIHLDLND